MSFQGRKHESDIHFKALCQESVNITKMISHILYYHIKYPKYFYHLTSHEYKQEKLKKQNKCLSSKFEEKLFNLNFCFYHGKLKLGLFTGFYMTNWRFLQLQNRNRYVCFKNRPRKSERGPGSENRHSFKAVGSGSVFCHSKRMYCHLPHKN